MFPILIFLLLLNIGFISGLPVNWLRRIAEGHHFDDFENYLPKFGDLPKYQYSTDNKINSGEDILFKSHVNKTENTNITAITNNDPKKMADDIIDVAEFFKEDNSSSPSPINKTDVNTTNLTNLITQHLEDNSTLPHNNFPKNLEEVNSTLLNDTLRFPRQELDEDNKDGGEEIDEPENKDGDKENAPQIDESSEEEGNEVTNLLGSLLGSLSRPDGSIDLEAITSLLGSLSTQNPDGSYNFDGLTELLMGFFGGGGEGGGGSDIASFLGGLVGAILKGSAQNPPGGPKGIGLFTGKLVGGILPALSGPQPTQDPDSTAPPPQGSDSASFIGGLIKGILQSSGLGGLANSSAGGSSSSSGSGGGSKGKKKDKKKKKKKKKEPTTVYVPINTQQHAGYPQYIPACGHQEYEAEDEPFFDWYSIVKSMLSFFIKKAFYTMLSGTFARGGTTIPPDLEKALYRMISLARKGELSDLTI